MKTFRTVFPAQRAPFTLTHADRLLLSGSCFTEHIGSRLQAGKFNTLINPNGIAYNPVSMARALLWWGEFSIHPKSGRIENLPHHPVFQHNGLWHSWEHHGVFSKPGKQETLDGIEKAHREAAEYLQKTTCLMLTLGTADVFVLNESGEVVANCHKAPANWFEQRRLSVSETVEVLSEALLQTRSRLPELKVILTVSPVRHLRNGFVENQRSKAVLVLACAELCGRFDFVHYFPAYELLLDDLRDYRFYAADMIHPNEQAIDYIWQYFTELYYNAETRTLLEQIGRITAAARHRPFNPDTEEHRAFARAQLGKIAALEERYPGVVLEEERTRFEVWARDV